MRPTDRAPGEPAASDWLVVMTHPSREAYATENLARQGFVSYYPQIMKRIRHARRVYDAPRPLFPSYVFVEQTPVQGRWQALLSTYGVRSVVRRGLEPGLLDGRIIEDLRAREVDGVVCGPGHRLVVGQEVRIDSGAFSGLVGTILELREKDRILVLMDLLNQRSKVFVTAQSLSPLPTET